MKVYKKLVRDKILEIIKADGVEPQSRILEDEEYKLELRKKIVEESNEVFEAVTDEELYKEISDVLEVIDGLVLAYNLDREKIAEVKNNRREKRGGFEKRIFLESTDEE